MHFATPLLLACIALASGCAGGPEVDSALTETLDLPVRFDNGRPEVFEIQFHRGFAVVQEGEALECQLKVDLIGATRSELTELREHVQPTVEEAPDGSHTLMRLGLPPGGRLDSIQTRYLLRVPRAVKLVVRTREGSVYVRAFDGDVEVEGGEGAIEAELEGGHARLSTDSGSITLRGSYSVASVKSTSGRVRVCLPPEQATPVDLEILGGIGETSVDVPGDRVYTLRYRGDENLLRADSLVELDWIALGEEDGEDVLVGRLGEEEGPPHGELFLHTGTGLVRLRRLIDTRP